MDRRTFLTTAAATLATGIARGAGPGFASPAEAIKSPPERLLYVTAIRGGTGVRKPDYLATIDADPASPTYSKVIHRLPGTALDDELHHFGWNTCSACHGDAERTRRFLVLPGLKSGRLYVADAADPAAPKMHKVIEPETVRRKVGLTAPHTVHCLPDGRMMISMLGDTEGKGPGGFLLLDEAFDVAGRWEADTAGMHFNYDFWYQPRHNVMVSSEWAAPTTFAGGFDPKDVAAGRYGSHVHFWDWKARRILKSVDLGEEGRIPLEVRFCHDPASAHGFVGAALSSTVWHLHKAGGDWRADRVIAVPAEKGADGSPVPGLITDLLVSMDDRFLYVSCWLHGDVRQYDISDPSRPRLVGQLKVGGLAGERPTLKGERLRGGPQMLQLSLDGKRLYVTNSLLSAWDDQFYPDLAKRGSHLVRIDCDTAKGGLRLNEEFFVDFGKEPDGPARAHEVRYPGGDCTSDVFG
jgi:selenium-binding protein 1